VKAIVFQSRNEVRLADLPDPRAGEGEVVVQVRAAGICHTDIEILRGNYGAAVYPLVPCHEYSGVVCEIGPGVSGISLGDRVVVDPNLECRTCPACRRGWAHLCENLGAYGVTANGGFSERSVVRASAVHPIGELPFHTGALAEPMGCVLNGSDAANRDNTRSALIFGAGPMGLLMALALRSRGVPDICVVDIDEERLELCQRFGFKSVGSASPELEDMKHAIDLVVDATGVTTVAAELHDYAANGGVAHYFGVCHADARIPISPFEIFRRQLSLVGSHSLNHNISQALAVISDCGPGIAHLVSHRLHLEDLAPVLSGKLSPKGNLKIQAAFPE
jgi:threonine dehydrogenase-like Zn-dependent dehydrogenase